MTEQLEKSTEAEVIVTKYAMMAAVAGAVPVPIVDFAAVIGIQLKMVSKLAGLYGVQFEEHSGRAAIVSLISSLGATSIARGVAGSIIKSIPILGTVIGSLSMPVLAGATTYAVGRTFRKHFELGGTLLDFEPEKTKDALKKAYEDGQAWIKESLDELQEQALSLKEKTKEFFMTEEAETTPDEPAQAAEADDASKAETKTDKCDCCGGQCGAPKTGTDDK